MSSSKILSIFLVLGFVFFANADSLSQTNNYTYQIPKKLNDGWSVWIASITKTITSTLIGIAVDKGYIESVDANWNERMSYQRHYKPQPSIDTVPLASFTGVSE